MTLFPEKTLVLASTNKGKLFEMQQVLLGIDLKITSASDYTLPEIEETGTTFEENALLKAKTCVDLTGLACLSDDSGLEIEALGGAPGLFSARFAAEHGGFSQTFQYLQTLGSVAENPKARMKCVLALVLPSGGSFFFEGVIEGALVFPPREGRQFGYDPIFMPQGFQKTFSQMTAEEKSLISHRGKALQMLKTFLTEGLYN